VTCHDQTPNSVLEYDFQGKSADCRFLRQLAKRERSKAPVPSLRSQANPLS